MVSPADGRRGGRYPGSIYEYEGSSANVVARWGIASRSEVGLRLGGSVVNWGYCRMSAPRDGICPAVAYSREGAAIAAVAKTRIHDGDGLLPAIAVGTSARYAEFDESLETDQTMTVRLGATVALSSRIGERGELGYGIGVSEVGLAEDNSAARGYYWLGLHLPIGSSILIGPEISGDVPVGTGATPTSPLVRLWFGASVRLTPESWPLFHLDGRVSRAYDEALQYEIRLGAVLASFRL